MTTPTLPPASAPVTLYRCKHGFSTEDGECDDYRIPRPLEPWRALPAPEFDRLERERDAAVALLKRAKPYVEKFGGGDPPVAQRLADDIDAFPGVAPCPPAKVNDGGAS